MKTLLPALPRLLRLSVLAAAIASPCAAFAQSQTFQAEPKPFSPLCIRAENQPDQWPDFAVGLQDGWFHLYGDFVPETADSIPPETDLAAPWAPWDWKTPATNAAHANRLWLRGILPDVPYPDKSLLLANFQCDAFAVFLDGKSIYQSGSFAPDQWIPSRPYRRLHLISMPSDAAGKTLHVLLFSVKADRMPPVEPIVLFAAQSKLVHHLVASEWINRSFGYLFLFVGLYGLFAFFIRRRYGIAFSPWLSFMAICLGLSELCSGNVMFMLSERAEWLYQVNILSFLLFPIGLWRFIEQTFGPGWKNLVRRCWQLELALAILLFFSDLFGWIPLAGPGKWIMYAGLGLQTLVGAGMALHGVVRGKGKERIVAIGLLTFAATGLVDIATVMIPFLPETELYLWGALALVAAMAWLQERDAGEAHVRLRNQTKELQTHRHRLEELVAERTAELSEMKRSFELAIHATGVSIWTYDMILDDFVRHDADGILHHVGTLRDQLSHFHPDDASRLQQAVDAAIREKIDVFSNECRILLPGGNIVWLNVRGRVVRNDQGIPVRQIGISLDVTDRMRLEEDLLRSRDAAQAANRAKSEFLANMSHELRTPLNAVLGYAQLLRRDADASEEQRERAAIIQQSGEHLLTVINDILDISKIEAGKLEIEPAPVRLLPLLKSIADMIAPRAQSKGLEFRFEPDPSLPPAVDADQKRLRQILLNLLSNAVKFTPGGHVRFAAAREGNTLVFRVSDSGIGIAPHQQEAIFEPFLQIPGQAQNEGTGLGLAISRRIARKMGGDVLVHSSPSQGSEFRLEIPCVVAQAETPAPSGSPAPFRGSGRILVADDRPENRAVLRHMLAPLGFEIIEAENGRIALDLAARHSPCLILMDLLMPELNGFEAVRLLKADPALASIPVVAVSASVYDQTQAQSLCAGCEGFLPKPVDFDALLALIQSLLHLESTAVPAPTPPAPCPSPLPADYAPLQQAALIGDVLRVLAETERLLPLYPAHAPFLDRVRHLAADFQIQALQRLLSQE